MHTSNIHTALSEIVSLVYFCFVQRFLYLLFKALKDPSLLTHITTESHLFVETQKMKYEKGNKSKIKVLFLLQPAM